MKWRLLALVKRSGTTRSGETATTGSGETATTGPDETPGRDHVVNNTFTGTAVNLIQAGHIAGDIHLTGDFSPLDAAARDLAQMVGSQWREEMEQQQLRVPAPVEVRWSPARPEPAGYVENPAATPRFSSGYEPSDLAETFRSLPGHRLVILGRAGTGKTTLAVMLTVALAQADHRTHPVPVLLSLRGWNPEREHLRGWIIRRIEEDYPRIRARRVYGTDAAHHLVTDRRVMPVLDGLDELPEAHRAAALREMNRALPADCPMVLTCRTDDYATTVAAGPVLTAAAVVEAEPVKPSEAARYLRGSAPPYLLDRWRPVLRALEGAGEDVEEGAGLGAGVDVEENAEEGAEGEGIPLAAAMESALVVWLARTVYTDPGRNPAELLDGNLFPDATAIEEHLIDALIPVVYAPGPAPPTVDGDGPRRPPARYPLDRARRWLVFLAGHAATGQGEGRVDWEREPHHTAVIGDVAWWRLVAMLPGAVLIAVLMLCGALMGAAAGYVTNGMTGFAVGVSVALIGTGFFFTFNRTPTRLSAPMRAWLHTLRRFPPIVSLLLFSALVAAAVVSLRTGTDPFAHGSPWRGRPETTEVRLFVLRFLLGSGLCAVLFVPLVEGWSDRYPPQDVTERALSPIALLRADRRNCLRKLLWLTLTFESILAVIGSLIWLNVYAVRDLLMGGSIAAGFFDCWLLIYMTAWGRWLVGRTALPLCGRLPWRVFTFLDDARQRGILRQVGGVYEFRHSRLRDRLAQLDTSKPSPVRATRGCPPRGDDSRPPSP